MFQSCLPRVRRARAALSIVVCAVALAACAPAPVSAPPRAAARPADAPEQALERLVADVRRSDFNAYARDAVPPALLAQVDDAWKDGRTLWPLTELPLDDRLPGFMAYLAAPDGEARLRRVFRSQFDGATGDVRSAAATLGLFGTQYLRGANDYGVDERTHYLQVVDALSRWGQRATLADRGRAAQAIPALTAAARRTGLREPAAFVRAGRRGALRRFGPFFARFKRVMTPYGLDIDAALDSARVRLLAREGDRARLSLDYRLAGRPIHAELDAERIDGRWYLSDVLRHARAESARR